jgi:hypothetical protein
VSRAYWASARRKKAATRLLANAASLFRDFLKELEVIAAPRRREASAIVWVIARRYWRKASAMLWVIVCRCWHKARETLWPAVVRYLGKTPKTQLAAVAAVALVSGVIGFLATNTFLQRPVAAEAIEAIEAPQPPKLSWITFFELQNAQKLGRLLLDISPADLLSKYEREGAAAVDVYHDGWVKLDYPITAFDRQIFDKASYDVVEARAHFNSVFPGRILAIFNTQKWHTRLAMHHVGDQIVAFCQFKEIDQEQVMPNIRQLYFYGIRCDMPQR